ncbi:hypothetical protein HXX76_002632 [Chlamydomonas incerta]|uniref:1,3-beta-glucan synthase n=1 Tax=Chlamydomonas incerta TaxID=51695 RepID=A0A835TEF1_CHLIN|nr:hypothetical protein HXX76_002632 [Chlamydomonas incerta]|eukprot:KAG2442546.1 hypothetical protein HXX76_002632 [Chlamydomonas incerta]
MQHLPQVALPGEHPSPQPPSRPQSGAEAGGLSQGYSRQWGSEAGGPAPAGAAAPHGDYNVGGGGSSGGDGIDADHEELAPRASWGLSILSDSQRRIPLAARPPTLGAANVSARSRQPSSSGGGGSGGASAGPQQAAASISSQGPSPGRAALRPLPQPLEPPAVSAPAESSSAVGAGAHSNRFTAVQGAVGSIMSSSGNPMSTPSQQSMAASVPPLNLPAGLRGAAYALAPPSPPSQLRPPARPPVAAADKGPSHAAGSGPSAAVAGSTDIITSTDVSVTASASAVVSGSSGHSSARSIHPQLPMPPMQQPPATAPRHQQQQPTAVQRQAHTPPHTPLPSQLAPSIAPASTPPGAGTPASASSPSSWGGSSAHSPPGNNWSPGPSSHAPNVPAHSQPEGTSAGGSDSDDGWYSEMLCAAGGRRPLLYGREWEGLVHEVTWRVARRFGFQAFNPNPDARCSQSPQWTPATAFLAGDHLCHLLARNLLPRMRPTASQLRAATDAADVAAAAAAAAAPPPLPGQEAGAAAAEAAAEAAAAAAGRPRFALAVYELHTSIFHGYERGWCAHVGLAPRPRAAARTLTAARWWDTAPVHGMLLELCLYFLLYSEAANLRHTPELLWFLFWAAAHSEHMRALWRRGMPHLPLEPGAAAAGPAAGQGQERGTGAGAAGEGLRACRIRLRNRLQRTISAVQLAAGAAIAREPPPPSPDITPAATPSSSIAGSIAPPPFSAAAARQLYELAAAAAAEAGGIPQPHSPQALSPELCAAALPACRSAAAAVAPHLGVLDAELAAELAAFGDGGFVTDRVVTPLFCFLSYEMDALFEAGVEVAHRLGYDDVNESLCRRDVLGRLLGELGVQRSQLEAGDVNEAWTRITLLGQPRHRRSTSTSSDNGAGGGNAAGGNNAAAGCRSDASAAAAGAAGGASFDAQRAANFWSSKVFVKTYRERRSWAAVFRAFYRIYSLQLVLLHLELAAAFAPGDWAVFSGAVLTHAWLAAAERLANWWMTRRPADPIAARRRQRAKAEARSAAAAALVPKKRASPTESAAVARAARRPVAQEGEPLLGGLLGAADWVLAAAALTFLYITYWQGFGFFDNADAWAPGGASLQHWVRAYWLTGAVVYAAVVVGHELLTTRFGYRVSGLALLPLPGSLRRLLSCYSAVPASQCWLEGRLGVTWRVSLANWAMWAVVMAAKVAFEYYAIAKPLVEPVRALLQRQWLGCTTSLLRRVLPPATAASLPCLDGDWLLVALRVAPLLLVCLADTTIAYNIVMALFGLARGLLRLDLGTVASWSELRAEFQKGPVRWWRRCMSAEGVATHRRALRRELQETGHGRAQAATLVPERPLAPPPGSDDDDDGGGSSGTGGVGSSSAGGAAASGPAAASDYGAGVAQGGGGLAAGDGHGASEDEAEAGRTWWADSGVVGQRRRQQGNGRQRRRRRYHPGIESEEEDDDDNEGAGGEEPGSRDGVDGPRRPRLPGAANNGESSTGGESDTDVRHDGGPPGGNGHGGGRHGPHDAPLAAPGHARGPAAAPPDGGAARLGLARGVADLWQRSLGRGSPWPWGGGQQPQPPQPQQLQAAQQQAAPPAAALRLRPVPTDTVVAPVAGGEGHHAAARGRVLPPGGVAEALEPAAGRQATPPSAGGALVGFFTPRRRQDAGGCTTRYGAATAAGRAGSGCSSGEEGERSPPRSPAVGSPHAVWSPGAAGLWQRRATPTRTLASSQQQQQQPLKQHHEMRPSGYCRNTVVPLPPQPQPPLLPRSPSPVRQAPAVAAAAVRGGSGLGSPRTPLWLTRHQGCQRTGGPVAEATSPPSSVHRNPGAGTRSPRSVAPAAAIADVPYVDLRSYGSSGRLLADAAPHSAPPFPSPAGQDGGSGQRDQNEAGHGTAAATAAASWPSAPRAALASTPTIAGAGGGGAPSSSRTLLTHASQGSVNVMASVEAGRQGAGSTHAASSGGGTGAAVRADRVVALARTEELSVEELLSRANGDLAVWDAFARVWDAVVEDLRAADLISDREQDNLRFMRLPAGHCRTRHTLRPLLLPAFFYAGVVEAAVDAGRLSPGLGPAAAAGPASSGATTTIFTELRSLLVWLGCELGVLSEVQAEVLLSTPFMQTAADVEHSNSRARLLRAGQALVRQLDDLAGKAAGHIHTLTRQQQQQQQYHQAMTQAQQAQGPQWHHAKANSGRATGSAAAAIKGPDARKGAEATAAVGAAAAQPPAADASRVALSGPSVASVSAAVAAAAARGVAGCLREVMEGLAAEARAMRRAVRSRRLGRAAMGAADELEEVVAQVLADVVARPADVLAACLANMLPAGSRAADACPAAPDCPEDARTDTDMHIDLRPPSQRQHPAPAASALASVPASASASQPTIPSLPSASTPRPPPSQASACPAPAGTSPAPSVTPEAAAEAESSPEVSLRRRVVGVLVKMLTTPASACRPASPEALRLLGFFVNSLSNPQLTQPAPLVHMPSWCVLTPCYEEDVLYPLDSDLVARQLGVAPPPARTGSSGTSGGSGGGRLTDLLSETEDDVSLMAYLRRVVTASQAGVVSVFPGDWANFLQRLSRSHLAGADTARVTENDFGWGGPLHSLSLQLQLWASYRGQLLARTVRGMMCYRAAVRLHVQLECPRPEGVSPEAYEGWVEALVGAKFQYVCACQVYGRARRAPDLRRRWLAESVDTLCLQYPGGQLQVAYLDSAALGPAAAADYSVLMTGNPNHPAAAAATAATARVQPPDRGGAQRHAAAPAAAAGGGGGAARGTAASAAASAVDGGSGAAGGDGGGSSSGSSGSSSSSGAAVSPTIELYRVRLPTNRFSSRGVIIGEGKPENQNHAVIFCFGEALQTIDMNQDNALAEALKMRNLLQVRGEAGAPAGGRADCEGVAGGQQAWRAWRAGGVVGLAAGVAGMASGRQELQPDPAPRHLVRAAARPRGSTTAEAHREALAARTQREKPVALVGFREWIFSDVSGALGTFAAAAEFAFGTIVQRVMSYPGRVRMHYGHPDVFNKLHIMTRGGVSKATRQLHISEDVFGGMNHTLRGGQIKYREYISCGKGRDMGFDSINAFEVKISGGGGECVVSRDVARLAPRLDLARLFHYYHSGLGYYINSLLIMTAVHLNIFVVAVFALARASNVLVVTSSPEGGASSFTLEDTLGVEHVLSLGPLMLLPYAAQLLLESGLLRAAATLLMQLVAGSLAFAVFRQQTTAAFFKDDITYGGARYISTGRGFSITSAAFTTLYTNYARSHLYLGGELLHLLLLTAAVEDCAGCSYAAVTWGTWLVCVSLLGSPLWFNPMGFKSDKAARDWAVWRGWMRGEADAATGTSWYTWHRKQLEKVRNERGAVTDAGLTATGRLLEGTLPRLVLAGAAASRLDLAVGVGPPAVRSPLLVFGAATALLWALLGLSWGLQRRFAERGAARAWRRFRVAAALGLGAGLVAYLVFAVRVFSGPALSNLALLLYVNSQLVLAAHAALEVLAPGSAACRALVDGVYWALDWLLGGGLLCVVSLCAWLGVVDWLQTRLLFSATFADSVRRGKMVRTIGLMKLDEEHKRRDEGEARAALARSAAVSSQQQPTAADSGAQHHYCDNPPSAAAGSGAVRHVQLAGVPPAPRPQDNNVQ